MPVNLKYVATTKVNGRHFVWTKYLFLEILDIVKIDQKDIYKYAVSCMYVCLVINMERVRVELYKEDLL